MTGERIIKELEANFSDIREEFLNLNVEMFKPWTEPEIYNQGWSTYLLYFFNQKNEEGCFHCPKTVALIEKFPEIVTAGYSRLAPGTHIYPHEGYTEEVTRIHLGIVVPTGDCHLRVEDSIYTWEEGKAFEFDDTKTHEAWNNTDKERVVLLLDYKK